MLHFDEDEFTRRRAAVNARMEREGLDALLLFAPESHYWLTGYDTFGYCFFQCLIWDGQAPVLLTRSADLRQAELTSNIKDIRIWADRAGANPADDLLDLLTELGLFGKQVGIETDTHGLTAANWRRVEAALAGKVNLVEVNDLISDLRLVKSDAELTYVRRAAELCDDALDAGLRVMAPGVSEGQVLAAMQGAVFAGGGGYPGNPFVLGSGPHALLCRTQSGRRDLEARDQITLEWAGVYRHYHAAAMRTVVIGKPSARHLDMHRVAQDALYACEAALIPGNTMGQVFDAHARAFDAAGMGAHRLNACGYSLGTRFAPSWMERQMFYEGAPTIMAPGMVFFLHMIAMDSDTGTAMTLGRTSLVTENGSEVLNHRRAGLSNSDFRG